MSFLAFLFILISLVTFVAAQLILKKAMEFSGDDGREAPSCRASPSALFL